MSFGRACRNDTPSYRYRIRIRAYISHISYFRTEYRNDTLHACIKFTFEHVKLISNVGAFSEQEMGMIHWIQMSVPHPSMCMSDNIVLFAFLASLPAVKIMICMIPVTTFRWKSRCAGNKSLRRTLLVERKICMTFDTSPWCTSWSAELTTRLVSCKTFCFTMPINEYSRDTTWGGIRTQQAFQLSHNLSLTLLSLALCFTPLQVSSCELLQVWESTMLFVQASSLLEHSWFAPLPLFAQIAQGDSRPRNRPDKDIDNTSFVTLTHRD